MAEERWLTVAQASEVLQVHPETLRGWLREARIPGTLISRRAGYRIRSSDLNAFLAGDVGAAGKEIAAT